MRLIGDLRRGTPAANTSDDPLPTASDTLQQALDWARVIVAALVIALVAVTPANAAVKLGTDLRISVGVVAVAYALLSALALRRGPRGTARGLRHPAVQVAGDIVLATIVLALVDTSAGPVAWVVLLVPILSAATWFGSAVAALTWLGLSLVFLTLQVRNTTGGSSGREAITIGVQQLMTLVLVAGVVVIVLRQLRTRADQVELALRRATATASRLQAVASASHRLAQARDPKDVLEIAAETASALGFVDAEIKTLTPDGTWETVAARRRSGGAAHPLWLPTEVGYVASITASDRDPQWVQALHLHGYQAGMADILDDDSTVLQVWVTGAVDDERDDAVDRHVFSLFREQVAMALRNTRAVLELEQRSQHFAERASEDTLTGLPNRSSLLSTIADRLEQQDRRLGVLFIDLDGFKTANDRYGHAAGDAVLVELALRFSRAADGHIVGRLGGDEFIVLVDAQGDLDTAGLCQRLVDAAGAAVVIGDETVQVSASIGVAFSEADVDADEVVRRADRAMYTAKAAGGSRFARWTAALDGEPAPPLLPDVSHPAPESAP